MTLPTVNVILNEIEEQGQAKKKKKKNSQGLFMYTFKE
jgi:hypothetical protein